MRKADASTLVFPGAIGLVVLVFLAGAFLGSSPGANGPSSTTSSTLIQGIVVGYVTVGPSQPNCPTNQPCTEDMGGYSLVFAFQCPSAPDCKSMAAVLSPAGHYSILLDPGNYTVTGLSPSCGWPGCSTAFPRGVTVQGGSQIVVNFDVDTGIS